MRRIVDGTSTVHVAIAAHDLYPDPGSGGSGRYVYEIGRRLADRGHDVSVLTRRRGDVPEREQVDGMAVYRYDLEIANRSAPTIVRQLPGSVSLAADHVHAIESSRPPDVISLQGPVTGPLLSALADDRIPRSRTFHSAWPTEYRIRTRSSGRSAVRRGVNAYLRRIVESRFLSDCDEVITLSAFVRDRLLQSYDGLPEPVVIPGGVDLGRYSPDASVVDRTVPVRSGEGISADGSGDVTLPGDPAFLTVRRLAERMGHQLLLEAFAAVSSRCPEARLYLAGDGPLRERLERRSAELGIDERVTFLGYVPDGRLPATYAAADAFVLPTTELEGFGLATLEALASGTPVIATPVGATPEVLGGLSALEGFSGPAIVHSVTAGAIAAAMTEWVALSDADRAATSRACRRYVERCYPWERTVRELESRYEHLARG